MGKIDYFLLTCFFSTSWNPKNGKITSFGVDMFFLKLLESKKWGKLISFGVDMFFSNSCKSKNGENWLVLVLTDWNLEPSAYTRIEGKIWKCKVAPKNNFFFQKGLNRHAYIHIHIYIYISQLLEPKKWVNWLVLVLTCFFSTSWNPKNGKITSFGVDMFFSNSWSPKNGENLYTSFGVDMFFSQTFGVDMFFSNSCKSKNGENWLVLVLTDWNLEPSAYTRIEGKIWKCKVAPKNNVFFQKGLNGHAYTYIYFSTPGIQKMGKLTNFGVDMFFLKLLESKKWKKY